MKCPVTTLITRLNGNATELQGNLLTWKMLVKDILTLKQHVMSYLDGPSTSLENL